MQNDALAAEIDDLGNRFSVIGEDGAVGDDDLEND